jgi:hypothetical protein
VQPDTAGGKVKLQINKKSSKPAAHMIQYSAKHPSILITPGGGDTDDPLTNGATAVVFSGTDCQCLDLAPAPIVSPGWTQAPASGTAKKYKWKDKATKSAALVGTGKIQLTKKGGITYGLDGSPQGEVEVQIRFGNSASLFCSRLAAPSPKDDTATKYKSGDGVAGFTTCSPLPAHCSCAEAATTTTSTTNTSTTTTTTTTLPPPCGVSTKCIFVTSTVSTGNLGGFAGADSTCNALATAAGLPGTYVAWLSDGTTDASARVTSNGPYVTPTGDLVASTLADLTDGSLNTPIDDDEDGSPVPLREVWTGTLSDGSSAGDDCSGWTSGSVSVLATVGHNTSTSSNWTDVFLQLCDRTNVGLYCLQQ